MHECDHNVTILHADAKWFKHAAFNVTSQFGEDGLIAAALERIGEANRWCFEVGAADGSYFSNTKRLRQLDWRAVLIEGDDDQFRALELLRTEHVRTIHAHVTPELFEPILHAEGAPVDLDVGVIDIDGQDYWLWDGMADYRPRLMLVECAYHRDKAPRPAKGADSGQAGFNAIRELGESKGYVALCRTPCNVLFGRGDVLG